MERRRYQLISAAAVLAVAATAVAQRDERALLLPRVTAPSAFAAIAPSVSGVAVGGSSGVAATGSHAAAGRGATGRGASTATAPVNASDISSIQAPAARGATAAQSTPAAQATGAASPARQAFVPVTPAGAGTGAGSQQTATTADPVGAVPEPESWLMMLMGIAGIGLMLRWDRIRREERPSFASVPLAE